MDDFGSIAKVRFKFLESNYRFRLAKCREENWGWDLLYISETTGVRITYEYRESYMYILLYELVDGELVEDQKNIGKGSILHNFGLDDIVRIRNASALVNPIHEYPDDSIYSLGKKGFGLWVSKFAENLNVYAMDVLNGDFTIFAKLDKMVKKRAER